jgi:hypothetical protein
MFVPLLVSENVPVPPVVGQLFEELELELVVRDELLVDAVFEEPDEALPPLPDPVPAPEELDVDPPPVPDAVPPPEPEVVLVASPPELLPREPPPPRDVPEDEWVVALAPLPLAPWSPPAPHPAATARKAHGAQKRRFIVIDEALVRRLATDQSTKYPWGCPLRFPVAPGDGSSESLGAPDPAALRNRRH